MSPPRLPPLSLVFTFLAFCLAAPSYAVTLEEAYDRTLATDQSIRTAYYEVKKANLAPWSALTRIAPSLTATPAYAHDSTIIARGGETGFLTSRSRTSSNSIDFTLSQTLIDFSVFPAFRLGRLTQQSSRLARQFTIRTVLFGVTTAYYEVLKQQRLVAVDQVTLDLGNQQLNLAQKRADVGEVTRTDVLRAQVTVESSRRILIEDQNTLELDRNTLRNILNYSPSAPLEVVEPPAYPTTLPDFDGLLAKAYRQREDLQVKDLAIAQDVQRKNEVLAQYAPSLSAVATRNANSTIGSSRTHGTDYQVDLAVTVPLFTGGQREIDLVTAKYQIQEDKLDRDKTAKTVENDVRQAWLDVKTLEGTLAALKTQVNAAEQSYHDLQSQYAAGAATAVDVLTGLNDLDVSRKDLAIQSYQYEVALRNLEQASGVFQEARVHRAKFDK